MRIAKNTPRLSAVLLGAILGTFLVLPGCGDPNATPTPEGTETPTAPVVTPTQPADGPTPTPTSPPGDSPTPHATETPTALDADGDGVAVPEDCDDAHDDTYPGAPELCDDRDNNCNSEIDEDGTAEAWPDVDEDGFGDENAVPATGCTPPEGYVLQGGDCDDDDPTTYPGATEACDGIDNNCDDQADEGLNSRVYYPDQDGDSYGAAQGGIVACERPSGYVSNDDDCDDTDPNSNPLKSERCDGKDNDCDGTADDGLHFDLYFTDLDGDGYGDRNAPLVTCGAQEGAADDGSDCDDTNATTHPNAPELCDGVDNNCTGPWDEGRAGVEGTPVWFRDQDADGFGAPGTELSSCTQPSGYVRARGDCDDTKNSIHPGAEDPTGDSIDQDCGGTAGPEPHVGLSSTSRASIQAAIDAASSKATIWVGPGNWLEHSISFAGKALTVASTELRAAVIDAQDLGSCVQFVTKEAADSVLDGFTLTGGRAKKGGALLVDGASPTLRNLTLIQNHADDAGGGISLNTSNATLSELVIANNEVVNSSSTMLGGGIAAVNSTLTLSKLIIRDNRASEGGGVYSQSSHFTLADSAIAHNLANVGGGISLPSTIGKSYTIALNRVLIHDNRASSDGGGISLRVSGATFNGCTLSGNRAREHGGGVYVTSGNPSFTNCTFMGNRANTGGGLEIVGSSTTATVKNVISAFNDGYNLYIDAAVVALTYTDLYSGAGPNHNLETLPSTNLTVDPGFITFWHDRSAYNDDDHLASSSPLRNKADPATSNPDGARADFGAYGGLEADRSYYLDVDGDGMYGGWELAHGLDPKTVDGVKDPDADGATNAREFYESGNPQDADTDDDGALDGAEVNAGADPADWYSQPGVSGVATAEIPGDFDSVQAAIDAVQWQGNLQLASQTFDENLVVENRKLEIVGGGSMQTALEITLGSGLTARWTTLFLSGVRISGGLNDVGAGIALLRSDAVLADVLLTDGMAGRGSGLYASLSTLDMDEGVLEGNCSTLDFSGALELSASTATLADIRVSDSACPGDTPANGVVLQASTATITGGHFNGNSGFGVGLLQKALAEWSDCEIANNLKGGLVASDVPLLTLLRCVIHGNSGGSGLYLNNTDPSITDCTVENNVSDSEGGGLYILDSAAKLTGTIIQGNSAKKGGGVYVENARPTLLQCLVRANTAEKGGGLYILDATRTLVNNSVISENQATSGGGVYLEGSTSTLEHGVIENNQADQGAGVFLELSDTTLRHMAITGNSANNGGGIYVHKSSPIVDWTVLVGNRATSGGGMLVDVTTAATVTNSILAYNQGYNLFGLAEDGLPTVTYSALYAPPGQSNHSLETVDTTVKLVEPGFLAYGTDGVPSDLHLAKTSGLIDAGDVSSFDPDFTRADMGLYGGDEGAYRDLDGDFFSDWFWPGNHNNAPVGFSASDYDCKDRDKGVSSCPTREPKP